MKRNSYGSTDTPKMRELAPEELGYVAGGFAPKGTGLGNITAFAVGNAPLEVTHTAEDHSSTDEVGPGSGRFTASSAQ